ncbi:leucine-rich repeat and fibronectin type-III domain-containing protein 5-like [Argopecten irradians]|uniref:leucine-rich repeat and fibronectin type-III domain-containing protein 5-like n=1 Tax=Argopecten irradians TaxID=31199 RepID=UPI0037141041
MRARILRALLQFIMYLMLRNNFFSLGAYVCPSKCRCHFNVTVSCDAGMQTIPIDISELTKSLHLAGNVTLHNSFKHVQSSDLPNMTDLRHFTFSFNEIEIIENLAFSNFKELRQLRLNHNKIKQIGPEIFSGLSKLEVLDLSGNSDMKIFDGTFRNLHALRELYLGEINLHELNIDVFDGLRALNVLDIHSNSIKNIGKQHIDLFPALNVLDISSNSLTTVDEKVLEFISKLQTIYISHNLWNCNCQMKDLKKSQALSNITNAIICAGPSPLEYIPLSQVRDSDLKCLPPKIIDCSSFLPRLTTGTGNGLEISCNISGDPFPYVKWKSPQGNMFIPHNSTVGSSSVYENGSLYISSASPAESGDWTLTVWNSEGMSEKHFKIDIQAGVPTVGSTTTSALPMPSKSSMVFARTNPGQIPTTSKPVNSQTPQHQRLANLDNQSNQGSTEQGWGYTGIIVASVIGGCSLIAIPTLLILLFKCISAKKKVDPAFTKDTSSQPNMRLEFV